MGFEIVYMIPFIFVLVTIFWILHHKKMKEQENDIIDELKKQGSLKLQNGTYFFAKDQQHYQIIFFYLPINHELTINSKTIWEIRSSGKSKLINQSKILEGSTPKIVIVFPSMVPIKRYINENEMEFVNYQSEFYNMRVLRQSEISRWVEEEAN
jgi:hypothetical protein